MVHRENEEGQVREGSPTRDRAAVIANLAKHLQLGEMDPLAEAEAYQSILEEFNLTQEELARRLGRSQSTVANKIRLLRLPARVQDALSSQKISERHARALLRLMHEDEQLRMLDAVLNGNLSVREAEEVVEERLTKLARQGEGFTGARAGQKVVRVFKDLRIFLNAIRQTVTAMQNAGIRARMTSEDRGDSFEITIRIAKRTAAVRGAETDQLSEAP